MQPKGQKGPRGLDRRWDKGRLDAHDALADAWLHLVEGVTETTVGAPGPAPDDRHVPRLLGRGAPGGPIAVLPGAHVRWLLARKGGFAVTEGHLRTLLALLGAPGRPVRVQVWDLAEPLPDELLDRLEERLGARLERFGPGRLDEVVRAVQQRLPGLEGDRDNWLLRAWTFLRRFPGAV